MSVISNRENNNIIIVIDRKKNVDSKLEKKQGSEENGEKLNELTTNNHGLVGRTYLRHPRGSVRSLVAPVAVAAAVGREMRTRLGWVVAWPDRRPSSPKQCPRWHFPFGFAGLLRCCPARRPPTRTWMVPCSFFHRFRALASRPLARGLILEKRMGQIKRRS